MLHSRLMRTAATIAIVQVVYWLYAFVAVPLIEPVAEQAPRGGHGGSEYGSDDPGEALSGTRPPEPLLERIRPFLPEDAWETDSQTMMMGSDQFTIFIHDYQTDGDKMLLQRCTVAYFPDGEPEADQADTSVIVLRAPQGAELTFEDGVDLSRLKMGKMQHCQLLGDVMIQGRLSSDKKDATATQDLKLTTRSVHMTEDRIWTTEAVQFELGENRGSGRKLVIELTEVEEIGGAIAEKKRTVQSVEIREDVRLQLRFAGGDDPLGAGGKNLVGPRDADANVPPDVVEITSAGPFRFDALLQEATFKGQVDVVRNGAKGEVDQLACELLSVEFGSDGFSSKIKPSRVEAEGHPVIGRRGSEDAELRCELLAYDLNSGEISLESEDKVMLRQGTDLVEASKVRFQPGPQGAIGEIVAIGQGRLQATLPDKEQGQIEAAWTKELRLRPHEGKTLLSVLGDATVRFAETGTLSSNEIWFWLLEQPTDFVDTATTGTKPAPRYTPHSMLANGRVTIDSAQLTGHTERLEMWFTPIDNRAAQPDAQPVNLGADRNRRAPAAGPLAAVGGTNPNPTRYDVRGDLVRVQIATDGRATALRDVTITGNVRMQEQAPAGAAQQKAFSVEGDSLQLLGADSENTRLIVAGQLDQPALVQAQGLTLSGEKIEGSKASNSMEVNGPGWMTLPMNQGLVGEVAAGRSQLRLDWKGGMRFDGQRVVFHQDVTARTPQQFVRTSQLIATLTRDIDFTDPGRMHDIGLANLRCPEEVTLENRSLADGQVQSIDRMQLRDLRIDQTSGDITAAGPGWIKTHRLGGQMAFAAGPPGAAAAPQANVAAANELSFLRVDFQQSVVGNFRQKRLTFVNQVKCLYGPVRDWQQELDRGDIAKLGPKQVELSCDRLAILEMPGAVRGQKNIDLDAEGNMRVDGEQFVAQGHRLSYNTGKEMLTLEGSGQRDAELWRDRASGGPRAYVAARKINYWKETGRVRVDGARFLDANGGRAAPPR